MNREHAKWLTYVIFVILAAIIIAFDDRPDSTLRSLALGASGSFAVVLLAEIASNMHRLRLLLVSKLYYRRHTIRFSISHLIRIKLDDKYVLIWSDRFGHFQPVGGVYKRLPGSSRALEKLGVQDDDKFPIDDETRDDLRVRVPGRNVTEFLHWFESGEDREIGPWREFYHELVESKILPVKEFRFALFRWVRRHATGIQFSQHFQCFEMKIADVFEILLTTDQSQALREAVAQNPTVVCLADDASIRSRGVTKDRHSADIAETAEWILD